ncbi:MAG: YceD family protein [Roseimicrobium sp.]
MSLKIDPRGLPPEGLHLEGQLPPSVFDLATDDPVKPISQLVWSLDAIRDDGDLVVTGALEATFMLQCGRCAESFEHSVEIPDYELVITLENDQPIDLTTPLREDILLALPTHPRCETGNVNPRECPAEGRFDAVTDAPREDPEQADDSNVWKSLDQLSNLKRN